MLDLQTARNELDVEIQHLGYKTDQYKISSAYQGVDTVINVRILDLSVDLQKITELAEKYKIINGYDDGYSRPGGNRFVHVDFDSDTVEAATWRYIEACKLLWEMTHGKTEFLTPDQQFLVATCSNDAYVLGYDPINACDVLISRNLTQPFVSMEDETVAICGDADTLAKNLVLFAAKHHKHQLVLRPPMSNLRS